MISSNGNSWRNVGRRIRDLRKENCLTLKQLARGCDLSSNTISLIEHGQVAPTIETLCKVAHALGVPAGSLFEDVCAADQLCGAEVLFVPRTGPTTSEHALTTAAVSDEQPHAPSGRRVLCVSGQLVYETARQRYTLSPGDSLLFAGGSDNSGLWRNLGRENAVAVMILPGGQKPAPESLAHEIPDRLPKAKNQ